ncbi:unnamed protein product, partial [Symbiodinium sp. CCMP2456]
SYGMAASASPEPRPAARRLFSTCAAEGLCAPSACSKPAPDTAWTSAHDVPQAKYDELIWTARTSSLLDDAMTLNACPCSTGDVLLAHNKSPYSALSFGHAVLILEPPVVLHDGFWAFAAVECTKFQHSFELEERRPEAFKWSVKVIGGRQDCFFELGECLEGRAYVSEGATAELWAAPWSIRSTFDERRSVLRAICVMPQKWSPTTALLTFFTPSCCIFTEKASSAWANEPICTSLPLQFWQRYLEDSPAWPLHELHGAAMPGDMCAALAKCGFKLLRTPKDLERLRSGAEVETGCCPQVVECCCQCCADGTLE